MDVLRSSSLVSKQFLSASKSDTMWGNFVSSACDGVVSRSSSSIPYDRFGSKMELFIYLCYVPTLLENKTKSFTLDKWSGKLCYTLGARALSITEGSHRRHWKWESIEYSRFPECAVMECIAWLEIRGKIHTKLLAPSTTYGVYFVYHIRADPMYSSGFEHVPVTVSISEINEDGLPTNYYHTPKTRRFYLKVPNPSKRDVLQPVVRRDGWMEIEMGRLRRYRVEGEILEMTIKECENGQYKTGLVIHGIEFRPLTRKHLICDQLTELLNNKIRP
ncbi:hypothetical protein RND81_02G022900 [Saponaria officinalis]|uniref:Uncharacterized protein n=1 Tax=Saponaria officinalis TaxID=3572 RepID=A0AAW1MP88_SAPOF